MKTKVLVIPLTTMVLVCMAAGISWSDDRFRHRQKKQLTRIANGIRSGEITNREFMRLNKEQWRIQQFKKRAHADGRISHRERRRLHHMQRKAGKHIYRSKHDEARYDGRRKGDKHCNHGYRPKHQRHHPKRHYSGHRSGYEGIRVAAEIFQPNWSLTWSARDAW